MQINMGVVRYCFLLYFKTIERYCLEIHPNQRTEAGENAPFETMRGAGSGLGKSLELVQCQLHLAPLRIL